MCDCTEKVNKMLAESNTVLDRISMLNIESGRCRESLVIAASRLDNSQKRSRIKKMLPSYCPFCGEKIKTTDDQDE